MSDAPILFSAPTVRAILAGQKTQTRRVLAPANAEFVAVPREYWEHGDFSAAIEDRGNLKVPAHAGPCPTCDARGWRGSAHRLWPRWHEGMKLWVREPWEIYYVTEAGLLNLRYAADNGTAWADPKMHIMDARAQERRTRSSIHMPRWASRITLTVTGTRLQRLQDISEKDAKAEGAPCGIVDDDGKFHEDSAGTHRCGFAALPGWDWGSNPWVVAVSFAHELRNIDAPAKAKEAADAVAR